MEKYFVTWEEVDRYVDEVVKVVKEIELKPTGVYGLPRGGLVLAVMISHRMNIPLCMAPAENCIVVDDIADSGRSLIHYTENDTQKNRYFITTMYYHPRSAVRPDYWMVAKYNRWIVFPWEVKE